MLPIDRHAYTNKLAHLDPGIKMSICAGAIALSMLLDNHMMNGVIFLSLFLAITLMAGIPFMFCLKVFLVPTGFLLMGFIGIVLGISPTDNFEWSLQLGPYFVGITGESLDRGLITVSRSAAALSATIFLALTTSADSMMRKVWKYPIPKVLLEIAILTYRSIFIFLEEALAIHRAQEIRHGHDDIMKSYRSWSLLVKQLFVRVMSRYQHMVVSMECRNYNGQFKMGD